MDKLLLLLLLSDVTIITQFVQSNLSVIIGETATLPCVATSAVGTQLSYGWTRNGTPLTIDGGRLYYVNNTGTIVINQTEIRDTGLYQCIVQTTLPNVSSPALTTNSTVSKVAITCKSDPTPAARVVASEHAEC